MMYLLCSRGYFPSRSFVMILFCHYLQSTTYMHLFRTRFSCNRFFIFKCPRDWDRGRKSGSVGKYEQFCSLKNYWFFIVEKKTSDAANCIRDVVPRGRSLLWVCVYFSIFALLDVVVVKSHIFQHMIVDHFVR